MVQFSKAFSTLVLLACSLAITASPLAPSLSHTTRRLIQATPKLTVEAFHPASSLETFGTGIDHPLSKRADGFNLSQAAVSFAGSRLSLDASSIKFRSSFVGDVAQHAFLTQTHNGIPFANAVANVVFGKDDKVVSFGSSFVKPKSIASSTPSVNVKSAIATAENALNGKFNAHPPTMEFFVKPDNTAILAHVIQIENEATGAWFEAFIDAHSNTLVSVTDFVAHASYLVLPVQLETVPEGMETLVDPQNLKSSPLGWHSSEEGNLAPATTGNNVVTFKGTAASTTSQSSADLNFIYPPDLSLDPSAQINVDAARTNAFYVVNSIHDITYLYGFTEAAFNFQTNNFDKGGKGNDMVTVSVQDGGGVNNANFATPADGQSGRMRMYLWNSTSPTRDGALENDIVTHEMTHGVSNRLTGGGTGRCLQTTEAGGMGEGWSDAMANWMEKTSAEVKDFVVGNWAANKPGGLRTHPYSTDPAINPLQYSDLQIRTEVHAIGEVWANILHNVYAVLVGAHGFSQDARTDPTGTEGNVIFLHLFLDALSIQPCNPTFLSARDAWIQADANRYGGANACLIWKAFASRGLGVGAANHVNNFLTPPACPAS